MNTFQRFILFCGVSALALSAMVAFAAPPAGGRAAAQGALHLSQNNQTPGAQGSASASSHSSTAAGALSSAMTQRQAELQNRVQEMQNRVQQLRAQFQDRIQALRARFTQKITQIQDKQKQELATRIFDQLDHVNKIWTDHFTDVLNHEDAILQKIQDRSDKAAANGKDVTKVNAAITAAKTAITTARTAVETQAGKTYAIDASTVGSSTSSATQNGQSTVMQQLRTAFRNAFAQLRKDLFALRDGQMKDSRVAVQAALQALKTIPGVDQGSTSSAGTSSTNGQ